jgi:hypothetical protein
MGKRQGEYRVLVGKPEGNRSLGRPMLMWENNIKIDLDEKRMAWTGLMWFRVRSSGCLLRMWQ